MSTAAEPDKRLPSWWNVTPEYLARLGEPATAPAPGKQKGTYERAYEKYVQEQAQETPTTESVPVGLAQPPTDAAMEPERRRVTPEEADTIRAELAGEYRKALDLFAGMNPDRLLTRNYEAIQDRAEWLWLDGEAKKLVTRLGQEADAADWGPIPLSEVSEKGLRPTFGYRTDGKAGFYAGKLNLIFGESDSAKTWIGLLACVQTVEAGGTALIIDFEDSAQSIKSRLRTAGLGEENDHRVTYINPTSALTADTKAALLMEVQYADVVLIDATSEAMAAYGLNSNSDVDVAAFYAELPKWIARQGPAVLLIDHTPKNAENRNGPQGSQHKRAGVDGCALFVDNQVKFMPGEGHSRVYVNKDKHAGVRIHSVDAGHWADLICDADGFHLHPPTSKVVKAEEKAEEKKAALALVGHRIWLENPRIKKTQFRQAIRDAGVTSGNSPIDALWDEFNNIG